MIIGITGKAGSGKDTFAEFLVKELNARKCKTQIDHFAAALKEIAIDCFGWDGKKDDKGRRLLQVIGTEAGREYNDTIWTDKVGDKIKANIGSVNYFLLPDTRFPNEVEFINNFPDMAGMVIHINRPELNIEGKEYTHSSETALDGNKPDVIIDNTGTMEDLKLKAAELAVQLTTENANFSA